MEVNDLRVSMGTPSDTQGDFSTARPQQPDEALSEKSVNSQGGKSGTYPKEKTGD